jgi:hypothetical protein
MFIFEIEVRYKCMVSRRQKTILSKAIQQSIFEILFYTNGIYILNNQAQTTELISRYKQSAI